MEKVRPKLPVALTEGELKEEELFQNMVLRPVIKMQHDLLIMRVKSHLLQTGPFNVMDNKAYGGHYSSFQNDHNLKIRMIIGQLTVLEFQQYLKIERSLNKRIVQWFAIE